MIERAAGRESLPYDKHPHLNRAQVSCHEAPPKGRQFVQVVKWTSFSGSTDVDKLVVD